MGPARWLVGIGWAWGTLALAQGASPPPPQPPAPAASTDAPADTRPLPDLRALVLDVERNQRAAEARRKDYTYHLHLEQQDLDGHGGVKKTTVTDSESLTLDGVRVNRVVARNGRPLTPEEAQKESERLDKEVARDKERRARREDKGEATDSRGDEVIPASRILELGTFSHPRRVILNGRPTIVADYAGDPAAKTHNAAEGVIRDLVGTVWIDEQDRVLVRGEGHFLKDFKVGGGLVLDVHKGLSFAFTAALVNGEVWLPATVDAQGSARILLFGGVNGRVHLVASDYRKFRATSTIVGTNGVIGTQGQPEGQPETPPAPTPPGTPAPKP